jgi:hypothetical protein
MAIAEGRIAATPPGYFGTHEPRESRGASTTRHLYGGVSNANKVSVPRASGAAKVSARLEVLVACGYAALRAQPALIQFSAALASTKYVRPEI